MCPFCSTNTSFLQPDIQDLRPLSILRLTDAEWSQYRKDSKPSDMYKQFDNEESQKLRVVGFNDDTKSVLRACSPQGEDYIEVGWSAMDSLLWIAQRIEDKIHVALHHWVLASSDGIVFKSFGELVCTSSAFKINGMIVLTLLVPSDLSEFLSSHVKEHKWIRTTPGTTESSDSREKAKVEFHLISPEASPHWKTYRTERQKDTNQMIEGLSHYTGEDLPFIYEKIESAVDDVFSSTDLEEEEADALHDSVIPLSPDVEDDGWGNIRGAQILTRIYSPCRPSAIDVYLDYYFHTRWETVEYFCNVWYRAHANVTRGLERTVPRSETRLNGFKKMMQMGFKDMPSGRRWRAVEERSFDMKESDVSALHRILFGEQVAENDSGNEEEKLSKRIGKADMIEFMLAGVGVSFRAAREAEEGDEYDMGEMAWEGLQGSERWLGRNIRCVCGIQPMEGDDKLLEDERDEEDEEDEEDEDEDSEWEDEPQYERRGEVSGCVHQ